MATWGRTTEGNPVSDIWDRAGQKRPSQLRLGPVEAVDFAADLAQRRACGLVDAGRLEEAITVYDEEARGYRARLRGVPGQSSSPETAHRQTLHLGKVLMEIGALNARLRRPEPALSATDEALAVARGVGPIDSVMSGYLLARILAGYAWVRASTGVELRRGLEAAAEADSILRGLAEHPPAELAAAIAADGATAGQLVEHLRRRCGR
jgi:tetratricopeptide (TPR) repeat protein